MTLMVCGLSHPDMEYMVYVRQLVISSSVAIGSLLLILLTNLLIALTVTALGHSMSWFSRPVWIFFLYICPTLYVPMTLLLLVSHWQRSVSNHHVISGITVDYSSTCKNDVICDMIGIESKYKMTLILIWFPQRRLELQWNC